MNIIGGAAKDDLVVLAGHEFKRVKSGLDEAEVASFIDKLIKERDRLAQAQEHITSLNRLAERAIVEADKLAAQIKAEATELARAESAAILDKAKEQARQIMEKKVAEAVALANEKANAIRAKAEEEAATLLENQRAGIRNELGNLVDEQLGYLLEQLESLKQQATALQADFHVKLSEQLEVKSALTAEIGKTKQVPPAKVVERATMVADEARKPLAMPPPPAQGYTDVGEEEPAVFEPLQVLQQPEASKPQWEVQIMPPFEIAKIMEVVAFLDQLPEVANTEMIVPQIDTPLILVFLHKPMNVVDVLRRIPAVAHVEELTADKAAANGRPRKARISLSCEKRP